MSDSKLPKVSVITVVRNDKDHIESTINSLLEQDYPNIEYIVIDGASTDGTIELLNKYKDVIEYVISEHDNGIYDAMNKGIAICTGDYIGILNSGDEYADEHTISRIFTNNDCNADIIYGDSIEMSESNEKLVKVAKFNLMEYGPIYRHGSSFVKASLHKKYIFDLAEKKLGYSLDWHLIYKLYKMGFVFEYSNCTIEKYQKDGVSANGYLNAWYNYLITSNYDKRIIKLIYFLKSILSVWISRKHENNKNNQKNSSV